MFDALKYAVFLIGFSFHLSGISQFTPTVGYQASNISIESDYHRSNIIVRNSNETYDYYIIHNHLNPIAHSVSFRSFGKKYQEDEKINMGYSLAIGLRHFTSSGKLLYDHSSTLNNDSIINAYNGYEFRANYTMVFFNHFYDFNFNLNERLKLTNSLGAGFTALMRAKSRDIGNATIVDNDFPVTLDLFYEIQIIEKYEKFDVSFFASINFFSFSLFNWKDDDEAYGDTRMKLSDLKFNGVGMRFYPHIKLKSDRSKVFD